MPEAFGLYIHWPFCQAKCPYCDFNSHVARHIDQKRWLAAYVAEIARVGALTKGRTLTSVFFGGGTPSLMDPETVDGIMAAVRAMWPLSNSIEVTLEANPTSIEAGRFHGYRQAGVNRISMGIQAMNDADLRALGRLHTVDEGLAAFETARGIFDRVSFDLIYARQGQGVADWQAELERALALGLDHLSLYQLTIEDGTAFGDRYAIGKLRGLPDEDLAADLYEVTQEVCEKAGLRAYEVSNHAKDGYESAHNLTYWRYQDYAGVGPGAHGRLTIDSVKYATETSLAPGRWLEDVETTGSGESLRSPLSTKDQWAERLLMGLRLSEGVDLDGVLLPPHDVFQNKINGLRDSGFVTFDGRTLRVTPLGRPVLNGVLRCLLDD
ncbi:radical SAM family heme chaperone HemW [Octadecabacter sp. SW4]|uniref:radical SAM family heme chaperone HemW n=1 Tax=Octadecabacter sp. SW4 TaxID=2602067 RepID=UPI0020C827BE|nr:radical SAM family heme chaperone HemW [Octadecabacter sp. SW4]